MKPAIMTLSPVLISARVLMFLSTLSAKDPVVFFAAILLLAAVAFLANYLPTHRAMRIAPLVALPYE